MGRDVRHLGRRGRVAGFNPRARVGRDCIPYEGHEDFLGFNPRARVGRDLEQDGLFWALDCVSIHAPAWGATGTS